MSELFKFQLIEINHPSWLTWVSGQPESILFHHPAWANMVSACYGYRAFAAVVFSANDEIMAGVPVIEINPPIGKRRWVSLPFTDHCQPLSSSELALQELQSGIVRSAEENGVSTCELRWKYPLTEMPCSSEFVRTTVDLSKGSDEVLSRIKSNHRRKFRSAVRRGIKIQHGTSLDMVKLYYQLQVQTRRRLGVPVQPWRFFELLHQMILEPGLGFVSLAWQTEEVVAGVIYLNWNHHLIYKFAASNELARKNYASDLLVWDGIEWGCQNNAVDLDLGRSSRENEGLRQYKLRWAAKETPIFYARNYLSSSNGLKHRLFPLVATVIQNSPEWVCRFSGQWLYRYFG